jgi:hypothetical protein
VSEQAVTKFNCTPEQALLAITVLEQRNWNVIKTVNGWVVIEAIAAGLIRFWDGPAEAIVGSDNWFRERGL